MNAIITIDKIQFPVIHYRRQRVITTDHLAQLYGTEVVRIQQNYARNPNRFESGKHYFKLEGDELTILKIVSSQSTDLETDRLLLTPFLSQDHTVSVAAKSVTGSRNPKNTRRTSATDRRFLFACRFSMADGAGHPKGWLASPGMPVFYPRTVRHPLRRKAPTNSKFFTRSTFYE
ncbi:MAG: ORF6N domain-containing protein [Candidatus Competibacter denitrificans]